MATSEDLRGHGAQPPGLWQHNCFGMAHRRTFRLGTRGSKLARWQSEWVAARLHERGVAVEIVEIATTGDVQQVGPVVAIGAQGVFTRRFNRRCSLGRSTWRFIA
jgi:hypothetical protein